jgi:alpha-mannosidase
MGDLGYNPKYLNSGGFHLEYTQRIVFHAFTPRIDCTLETRHVKGRHYRLRAVFPLGLDADSTVFHEIPFGELKRTEGEFLAQNYIRCEDEEKGVAIINKGIPGNNVTDNVMMLSLMRSAYQEYLDPCEMALEEGETHFFEYAILPYKTDDRPDFARIALEFNTPPIVCRRSEFPADKSFGTELSASFAGLNVTASEICCSAVYSEDGDVVVRVWNSTAKSIESEVISPSNWRITAETNALLEKSAKVAAEKGKYKMIFAPFEIKTLLFELY